MPTRITISRKDPATQLVKLQKDAGVQALAAELSAFLSGTNPMTLISADVADALSDQHQVTTADGNARYYYEWNPVLEIWEFICVTASVITVDDGGDGGPIEITLARSATYGG
jgi:hypothetical protein